VASVEHFACGYAWRKLEYDERGPTPFAVFWACEPVNTEIAVRCLPNATLIFSDRLR
jgi:hypothetical protein